LQLEELDLLPILNDTSEFYQIRHHDNPIPVAPSVTSKSLMKRKRTSISKGESDRVPKQRKAENGSNANEALNSLASRYRTSVTPSPKSTSPVVTEHHKLGSKVMVQSHPERDDPFTQSLHDALNSVRIVFLALLQPIIICSASEFESAATKKIYKKKSETK
jgi:hypothetical protein